MNRDLIDERVIELKNILVIKLSKIKSYTDLSEQDKIPFRIMQAEILALKEYSLGEDLSCWLKKCINEEMYCASEGIKKVNKWVNENY